MKGYESLFSGAAWHDVSKRGRIRITGEDRKRLVHAMCTNHIQDLTPGKYVPAFFLTAQGRILSDVIVVDRGDDLLLDLEPEVTSKIYQHLDRFIIADDATLEDITNETAEIAVAGPKASEIAGERQPDFRIHDVAHYVMPVSERDACVRGLLKAGAVEASEAEWETWRVENGWPRYGTDITETNLTAETGVTEALHFNKGCYIGQEIVERIRSRGHVNKSLVRLRIEGNQPPEKGTKILAGSKEAGEITSAVFTPRYAEIRALGYLRAEHQKAGAQLSVGDMTAQVL